MCIRDRYMGLLKQYRSMEKEQGLTDKQKEEIKQIIDSAILGFKISIQSELDLLHEIFAHPALKESAKTVAKTEASHLKEHGSMKHEPKKLDHERVATGRKPKPEGSPGLDLRGRPKTAIEERKEKEEEKKDGNKGKEIAGKDAKGKGRGKLNKSTVVESDSEEKNQDKLSEGHSKPNLDNLETEIGGGDLTKNLEGETKPVPAKEEGKESKPNENLEKVEEIKTVESEPTVPKKGVKKEIKKEVKKTGKPAKIEKKTKPGEPKPSVNSNRKQPASKKEGSQSVRLNHGGVEEEGAEAETSAQPESEHKEETEIEQEKQARADSGKESKQVEEKKEEAKDTKEEEPKTSTEVDGEKGTSPDKGKEEKRGKIKKDDTKNSGRKKEEKKKTKAQHHKKRAHKNLFTCCLLYTSPSPRDATLSRMPSSA
eukprot:TRINITY_DN1182_c0_g1_i2.p1 TRINITY_DN1182_c0_g1~~TRINITY_DN1182_c0_g1_i2.p1  ORF type:complete len:426 (+),score=167.83 TRINITY_DN1182_c0_g1_i2:62-1339(+)